MIEAHEDLINNSLLVCLVEGREKKRTENGKRNEKEKKRKENMCLDVKEIREMNSWDCILYFLSF